MNLEELRRKRQSIDEASDNVLENMDTLASESLRVADIAHNSRTILAELDAEFERKTGLDRKDFTFLFFATALQILRILIVNKLTQIEKAGSGKIEKSLKDTQKKIMDKLGTGEQQHATDYYAPLNQIATTLGVPYDATQYAGINQGLFEGANHRFATVGHDPLLGLVFGTANILTNTITCVDEALLGLGKKGQVPRKIPIGKPLISSNHVRYTEKSKSSVLGRGLEKRKETTLLFGTPKIGEQCSTALIISKAADRVKNDSRAVVAATIKQVIHIGTDLFTPCGIQIPGANLVFSNNLVETITKYVSTGDLLKTGASAAIAALINLIIGTLHGLLYDESVYESRDVYAVKTRKILMWSNIIATGSNVIWVGANVAYGDMSKLKSLDVGGLLITMHRIITDTAFIRQVKEEYVFGTFNKMIQGDSLELKEVR